MKKLLFVFNPQAGKTRIKSKILDIVDIFVKAGYLVTVYPTQKAGDAGEIVMKYAHRYDVVVCSGGDGTLNETVSGMLQATRKIPIGYIPAGTTNDYAKSLGIPTNMVKAAQLIADGNKFRTDIGFLNEHPFVYIAAFGLFTDVSYQTKQEMKNAIGHSAYVLEGMKRLLSIKPYRLKARIDDIELDDEFIYGMVTNSISVGGFKNFTGKGVVLDDGKFEVTFVRFPQNPIEFQEVVSTLLLEDVQSNLVYTYKAHRVEVISEEEIAWTMDGEYGGSYTNTMIENREHLIDIMVDTSLFNKDEKGIRRIQQKPEKNMLRIEDKDKQR